MYATAVMDRYTRIDEFPSFKTPDVKAVLNPAVYNKEFEAKKKRICEMREDGSYTKEEFLERRQEIENQVAAVKISMAECRID